MQLTYGLATPRPVEHDQSKTRQFELRFHSGTLQT